MARSTSTYGRGRGERPAAPPAPVGHPDPDFDDPLPTVEARHARGESWCHHGAADGSYTIPAGGWTAATLGAAVRLELHRAATSDEPTVAEGIRQALNTARERGQLDAETMIQALSILRGCDPADLGQAAPASPAPQAPRTVREARPNRYAGRCVRCGGWVEAEAGALAKDARGRWAADHRGDCPEVPEAAPVAEAPAATVRGRAWETVPDGYYATASRTGNNDLDFWMVRTATDGDWAGFRSVSRVIGGRADERVRGGERKAALEAIAADPDTAARTFADQLGRCYRCNRHLTDEASRAAGMGPECRSK